MIPLLSAIPGGGRRRSFIVCANCGSRGFRLVVMTDEADGGEMEGDDQATVECFNCGDTMEGLYCMALPPGELDL